jgi:myo-inositol-1(or 4)-monophosphatase
LVDPLDGTNNFASGLPTFATAVAVRRDGRTRVAAIHEPIPDDLYLARHGRGATVNGEPIRASSDVELEHGTVAFVVGLPALRDPALRAEADRMETALQDTCKRVLQTWAPCVDWGLLARGGIEGLVAFHPASYERHAGELLAIESGASVRTISESDGVADDATGDGGALSVSACDESTLEELVAALGYE